MGYYCLAKPALDPPGGTLSLCISNYQKIAWCFLRTYICDKDTFLTCLQIIIYQSFKHFQL